MPCNYTFRYHETAARMITHRLPWITTLGGSDPLSGQSFTQACDELLKLPPQLRKEESSTLKLDRQRYRCSCQRAQLQVLDVAQWIEAPAMLGLVTDPVMGPEFLRQLLPIVQPSWGIVLVGLRSQWK